MTKMAKFCAYSPAYLIMSLAALVVSIGFSAHLIALAIPTGSPASIALPQAQTAASELSHTVSVFLKTPP